MLQDIINAQKLLDERIETEKGLDGDALISEFILAFTVEVGEMVNEWRRFKVWSQDREPRPELLEEYVDGLHFVISVGNKFGMKPELIFMPNDIYKQEANHNIVIHQLHLVIYSATQHAVGVELPTYTWETVVSEYLNLGVMLGFDLKQIYDAYFEKNQTNHTRQDNNY